ncbi:hypothetical protein PVL29_013992 [Vitis rotundifolia]|uniref:PMI1/PMIR1-2 C-terminal domain-containing protein n=1 Tax=Vitis rotundifolia TaxID=103349 RepID=A0AA38ZGK3_VITRO|nr:hypothetical protein PVL29_013992 [Vitis rotundifolia]
MDKIEALSIEGLRIQTGMVEEDAPSNVSVRSIGEISALKGKGVNITGSLGLEGAAGLQLLDIKDVDDDLDGLMGLSLTLDEWMRLDQLIGTPMLALIKVERVFVPSKPKIYSTVSVVGNSKEEDDESVSVAKEDVKDEKKEEKITEVHVAGLKTEPGKKKLWGTSTQQQSGSR